MKRLALLSSCVVVVIWNLISTGWTQEQPQPAGATASVTSATGTPDTRQQEAEQPLKAFDLSIPQPKTPSDKPVLVGSPEAGANLQVLPVKNKAELYKEMEHIATSLGVQCNFCHFLDDPQNGFARDDKETKQTARAMILMRQSLNNHLATMGFGDNAITCYTCHRGSKYPQKSPAPMPQPEQK